MKRKREARAIDPSIKDILLTLAKSGEHPCIEWRESAKWNRVHTDYVIVLDHVVFMDTIASVHWGCTTFQGFKRFLTENGYRYRHRYTDNCLVIVLGPEDDDLPPVTKRLRGLEYEIPAAHLVAPAAMPSAEYAALVARMDAMTAQMATLAVQMTELAGQVERTQQFVAAFYAVAATQPR
jgi:hypothetical protein